MTTEKKTKRSRPRRTTVHIGFTLKGLTPAVWAGLELLGIKTADGLSTQMALDARQVVAVAAGEGKAILAKRADAKAAADAEIAALEERIAELKAGEVEPAGELVAANKPALDAMAKIATSYPLEPAAPEDPEDPEAEA